MKKLILILFICTAGFSQEAKNFKLQDNSLVWDHVFNSDLSQEKIKSILEADPFLNPLAANFSGESNPIKLNCEETTAIYWDAQLYYFARIQFKEGKYKVEVSNFQLLPSYSINLAGIQTSTTAEGLDKYIVKHNKPEIRSGSMHQNALECLDQYLLQKFSFQEDPDQNNW